MSTRPIPPGEEVDIGLEHYYTTVEPLGGKLKSLPEDFIVKEISQKPESNDEGEYVIASLTVRNWETNRLVKALSMGLGMSRKRIGFGGTKDKRAVTTQLMSFRCPIEEVLDLSIKDVEISDPYRSNRDLSIGDLFGNEFDIIIRDIPHDENRTISIVKSALDDLIALGGFPNYFGIQRFGSVRPITHLIGKHILRGDYDKAVMTYVAYPLDDEPGESFDARSRLEKDKDFVEALEYYPKFYTFERSMIHHLAHNPGDWIGALNTTPDNLKMMFIHAYQSYIFNKILSERIRREIPLNEPIIGDIILPLNKKNLPDHHRYIEVNSSNIEDVTTTLKKGLGFISGPLMGNEEKFAGGEVGEIERSISSIDGIVHSNFILAQKSHE